VARKVFAVLGLVAVAAVLADLYVQSQVYYPIVRLELPDDLQITALLPETAERKACGEANDRFVAPFKLCKECRIAAARCERELSGLELAMRQRGNVPHPMVVAQEVRIAVMGPAKAAQAGCQIIAADMVARGLRTAACVPAHPEAQPKS